MNRRQILLTLLVGVIGGALVQATPAIAYLATRYLSVTGGTVDGATTFGGGITMGGNMSFDPTNTHTIGTSASDRPATIYATQLLAAQILGATVGSPVNISDPDGIEISNTGADTPAAPATGCADASDVGTVIHYDDTNDATWSQTCICATNDSGAVFDWRLIGAEASTACPFF